MRILKFIKSRWYIIAGIVIIVLFILYQRQKAQTAANKNTTYTVKRQTLQEDLSLSGKIDAEEKVTLTFPSSGKLVSTSAKEGDHVMKDQVLATLDQRDIQLKLQKYLNTYAKTRIDFEQSQSDTREVVIGGLTQDQRQKALRASDQSQQTLNNSVLDVELQNLAYQSSFIISPIDGILVQADAQYPGMNVTAASQKYVVINPATIYFAAIADQTDLPKLQGLYQGSVTLDAYPDTPIHGVVGAISFIPKEDESGTVYEVKIFLPEGNPNDNYQIKNGRTGENTWSWRSKGDYKYRLGMTGDISFVLRKKQNAIAVPNRFIKSEGGRKYVYKLQNGQKLKTYIQTGDPYDIDTEVIGGLYEGDIIGE